MKNLSGDQERELILNYQRERDKESLSILVLNSLPYISKVCQRFNELDPEELIHEGILGFIDAVSHYDLENQNCKLLSFAKFYILGRIKKYYSKFKPNNFQTLDIIENNICYSTEAGQEDSFVKECLENAVEALNPRQKEIVSRIFYNGETLLSVANSMNISKERVRQIKFSALKTLKEGFLDERQ